MAKERRACIDLSIMCTTLYFVLVVVFLLCVVGVTLGLFFFEVKRSRVFQFGAHRSDWTIVYIFCLFNALSGVVVAGRATDNSLAVSLVHLTLFVIMYVKLLLFFPNLDTLQHTSCTYIYVTGRRSFVRIIFYFVRRGQHPRHD